MPNGYVSQIQINGGDVQNIGSCAYAVCDTAEDVSVKVVTLPGFVLKDGATIHVKFMYRNIAFNPKLNVNGTGGKTILLNTNSGFDSSLNLSSQYNVDQLWMAGAVVTLTYDGTYWVVNNPSRITSPYTYNLSAGNTIEPDSYMILADIEWELCNSSSSATARVFPFKVCMSTMVDGLYRDRSAIMEVFVGGSYNKKDYVDIMIHDESEYHVNDDYVFDSLVDSIFIYFEYEVSSSNVISKRTGHLLGKVPSRWSSFQLVPLTNGSVSSANPDEDHHFLKLDIAHSASSFVPSETSQTSIPSGNILPTTVGVHRYLIKARMKPFDVEQISGVLPISKGGTGATTAIGAEYNILNQVADIDTTLNDDRKIALCNQTKSSSNGVFRWIKLSNVWNWIKTKFDTTPTANSTNPVTSGGIKTALDAKQPTISVTTNTSTPADNDTIIMQASGTTNTTTFLRRTMSKIWDYIKSKADSAYINVSQDQYVNNLYMYANRIHMPELNDTFYNIAYTTTVTWVNKDSTTDEVLATYDSSTLFKRGRNYSRNHPEYGTYDEIVIGDGTTQISNGKAMYVIAYNGMYSYTGANSPSIPTFSEKKGDTAETAVWTDFEVERVHLFTQNDGAIAFMDRVIDVGLVGGKVWQIKIKIQGINSTTIVKGISGLERYNMTAGYSAGDAKFLSAVTKHAIKQDLYGEVEAPKFIMRGGTSQQVLLANGTTLSLPVPVNKGGTGATTALNAEYNLITKPRTTELTSALSDDHRIPFCNTSPSTSVGTFAGYRKASAFWTYIQGKADEVYALWNGPVNTPGCLRSQYQLYDWRLHDYFYALDKRITSTPISWKTYDSETNELIADYSSSVNKLFDGNITTYDTGHPVEGQYDVIYITSSATFTTFAGKLYLGFYHKYVPEVDPVVRIKRGDNNAWVTLTPTKYLLTLSADRDGNCYYLYTGSPELTVTDIEITIQGRADRAVYLSNVCFFKYRCNTEHYSAVTKHAVDQNLYGNVIAPKFTVRGGTSQQVLLANGATINLPSTTGTNKDTLLKNLVSGLSSGTSNVTDTTEIVTSYAGANANGFSTTDHVNQPYKRPATTFWNYIKGKADAVYATIASLASYYTKSEVDTALDGKKNLFTLTNSWIGQNLAGTTYGVACRFKLTSVSEARTIYMRINARGVIHNLRILASSSSLAIGDQQVGNNANDDGVYGHLDTSTGIVTIYLKMRDYREGASVTEFNPANYYYYNNRLTDVTFPNKESVNTLPEGYVTASQDGWARYDKNGNDISTYYQPKLTLPLSVTNGGTGASDTKTARLNLLSDATEAATDASDGNFFAFRYQTPSSDNGAIYYRTADKVWNWIIGKITAGTGLSKSGNTINHSNSVTAQTSGLGSSVRIPAIKYDAQGHITYGTYYSVFSSEQYSAVKCGYISNGTNGAGWYKIADITYWGAAYTKYDVIISVVGTGVNAHDVGLLRIRGINAATAGVITGVNMGWIYKTPGTSNGFATNCIRATKTETNSSSGATLSLFIYIPVNDVSYNFLVLNEGLGGTSIRGHKLTFVNSTTKQTTEPAPTYATNFLPLEIGNQSNCLEITDSNWQSYLTASIAGGAVPSNIANGDILTIPEGVSQVFFNTTNEASIALVRGASTLNRFPRNGVRITIAGNWKPQENGGYSGSNAVGRFSAYLYVYRGGVASSSANYRMTHAFEDFMYFNGVWYSKGY